MACSESEEQVVSQPDAIVVVIEPISLKPALAAKFLGMSRTEIYRRIKAKEIGVLRKPTRIPVPWLRAHQRAEMRKAMAATKKEDD